MKRGIDKTQTRNKNGPFSLERENFKQLEEAHNWDGRIDDTAALNVLSNAFRETARHTHKQKEKRSDQFKLSNVSSPTGGTED